MKPKRLRILAMEDDPSDAILLERFLGEIPEFEVDLCVRQSLADGLTELSSKDFDVVLLDYDLGKETGLTFLKALKEAGQQVPAVFLTGRGDEQLAVEAMRSGAADYMAKSSVSPRSLQRAITNAMEKSDLQILINSHRSNLERSNCDLAERNQQIEGFYHSLSHELKTPLTSIREFLSIVLDGLTGNINLQQREYLEIALDGCDQMTRCVNDLLDVTRLETGKFDFDPKPMDLANVVCRITKSMEPFAKEREIAL